VGVGRFIALLAEMGFRILPVGVYEEGGNLYLCFGESYSLPRHLGKNAHEKDETVSRMVMEHIACLLPDGLKGTFGSK
jgi:hypothetical protein